MSLQAVSPASDRRTQRRESIIATAARLFARLGYAGCEMDLVATEAKIAKGTVYLYFPGKQELFFACVDAAMRQMQDALKVVLETDLTPLDKIAAAIRAYLEFFDRHPEFVELLVLERGVFRDRGRSTYFEYRDASRAPWRMLYQDLIDQGELRSDIPVDRILDTLGSLLYGTMSTNHFAGRTVTLDEQQASIIRIVFEGLLPRGACAQASRST